MSMSKFKNFTTAVALSTALASTPANADREDTETINASSHTTTSTSTIVAEILSAGGVAAAAYYGLRRREKKLKEEEEAQRESDRLRTTLKLYKDGMIKNLNGEVFTGSIPATKPIAYDDFLYSGEVSHGKFSGKGTMKSPNKLSTTLNFHNHRPLVGAVRYQNSHGLDLSGKVDDSHFQSSDGQTWNTDHGNLYDPYQWSTTPLKVSDTSKAPIAKESSETLNSQEFIDELLRLTPGVVYGPQDEDNGSNYDFQGDYNHPDYECLTRKRSFWYGFSSSKDEYGFGKYWVNGLNTHHKILRQSRTLGLYKLNNVLFLVQMTILDTTRGERIKFRFSHMETALKKYNEVHPQKTKNQSIETLLTAQTIKKLEPDRDASLYIGYENSEVARHLLTMESQNKSGDYPQLFKPLIIDMRVAGSFDDRIMKNREMYQDLNTVLQGEGATVSKTSLEKLLSHKKFATEYRIDGKSVQKKRKLSDEKPQ